MKSEGDLKKNTALNTIQNVSGIVFPLITVPYISRVLLTDNVGKVNFGNSVVSYFSLLASLGVFTYAVRECAKVKSDRELLGKTVSEIMSINLLMTVISYIALAVTLLCAKPLENYRILIIIQSISIILTTIGTDWLNTALEKFAYTTIRTIAVQIIAIVLMLIFVREQSDYLKYAAISVFASSGSYIPNFAYRRKFCKVRPTLKMNLKKHFMPILVLFGFMIASIICTNSDITILGLIKGDYEVGLYSTSVKIYNLANTAVASITWVVVPQLSIAFSQKKYDEINSLLKYALNFIMILGIPCVAGMEIIAPQLIELIAGKEYIGAALSLRILGIALMLSFIVGWMGNLTMLPSGREIVFLLSTTISAIVNIILNIICIPTWGLNAAAATTAISLLIEIIVLVIFMDKRIRIGGIAEIIKAPLIGAVGICVLGYVFQRVLKNAYLISIITILSSVVLYVFVLLVTKNTFFYSFIQPIIRRYKNKQGLDGNSI